MISWPIRYARYMQRIQVFLFMPKWRVLHIYWEHPAYMRNLRCCPTGLREKKKKDPHQRRGVKIVICQRLFPSTRDGDCCRGLVLASSSATAMLSYFLSCDRPYNVLLYFDSSFLKLQCI